MPKKGRLLSNSGEAIKRNPNDPLALIHLSFAHFNTGNPEKARDALERFLELVPESAIGWVKLGYCLNALDDKSGSLKAFERALELDPDHTAAQEAIEELHLR